MRVSELIEYLSNFPMNGVVELKISGFDDAEDGRLNLFGWLETVKKSAGGYPQLGATFDTAEPYDWGD